ncbi:MAG: hypothetical protein AB1746_02185 [Candidatus Zixiibacteriota bacterium]
MFKIIGYDELYDIEHQAFIKEVIPKLHSFLEDKDIKYKNRLSDVVILIHDDHPFLAKFANKLINYFSNSEYKDISLLRKYDLSVCSALHFGEFKTQDDPFQGRLVCFGREIYKTNKILNLAPPNTVLLSHAAFSAIDNRQRLENKDQFKFAEFSHSFKNELGNIYTLGGTKIKKVIKMSRTTHQSIDRTKFKKIQTIFSSPLHELQLHKCHKTNEQCSIPMDSLCLVAELIRNTEALAETHEFYLLCEKMYFSGLDLRNLLYSDNEGAHALKVIDDFQQSIKDIYSFFNDLIRVHYKEKLNSQKRFEKYLNHRRLNIDPSKVISICKLAKRIDTILLSSPFNNLDTNEKLRYLRNTIKFRESVRQCIDFFASYRTIWKDLSKSRLMRVKDSVAKSMDSINDLNLEKCLADSIDNLPHNLKSDTLIPKIWPRGLENL